jgi:3,4-dihydroxy 2-butanone 4-phosphate synthase / GTP cyclohydrolase II
MLVVVDDEDRENEGDITIAAELITPELVNFMAVHARGLICLALAPELCDQLQLPLMSPRNTSNFGTAFTESIDAREGTSTGISAADRSHTILTAMRPECRPHDLSRPGHMFPLRAREGGVLVRAGQTEAAVDLARLSGLKPGGVICEIMLPDGTMARLPQLIDFCRQHSIRLISVADLIRYRLQTERFVHRFAEGALSTPYGNFRTIAWRSTLTPELHTSLVFGELDPTQPILVRMHSHCVYGDVFASTSCNCHRLLHGSMKAIAAQGSGVIVYLHQNGPGGQIAGDKVLTHGIDYTSTNKNELGLGAQILSDLGISRIRLLTNSPRRLAGLDAFNIEIVEHISV